MPSPPAKEKKPESAQENRVLPNIGITYLCFVLWPQADSSLCKPTLLSTTALCEHAAFQRRRVGVWQTEMGLCKVFESWQLPWG